jgi:PPK2 family polyphosphate:nucleotide phosphotransferase
MGLKKVIQISRKLAQPYRLDHGKHFRLKKFDPGDTAEFTSEDKKLARDALATGVDAMAELQDMLYAQDRFAVLLIFQAMDAAGKDGAIKHVMSGVNPQGCEVTSFKLPSSEELDHDFLWRSARRLPARGRIGIFNRSYYEETLVARVHPVVLASQRLPESCITKKIWQQRFDDIRAFERHLVRNGTIIRKFFLHVSKPEQRKRFLKRLELPAKNWKFSESDLHERKYWDQYQTAYEETIRATATPEAPWYIVPADNKWYTRIVVAAAIVQALASRDLTYPKVSAAVEKEIVAAKKELRG